MYRWFPDEKGVFHHFGKCNHQVSVRLPAEVYDVIYFYRGDNFSEKLINFVIDHALSK